MYSKCAFLMSVSFFVLSSCTSYKNVSYFQGLDRTKNISAPIVNYTPLAIQPGDILEIAVRSLNPEGSAIFNSPTASSATGSGSSSESSGSPSGYLVDQNGEIQLPVIAAVKVSGLTTSQLQAELKKSLLKFLKEPVVSVRIINFKISVLGDVNRPGMFNVKNDRITIPEALSLAGDLTITAKRQNILLIRETNGERELVNIDITSNKLFESKYYYTLKRIRRSTLLIMVFIETSQLSFL
jgi:polysaccharide export outer membrane protein